jgi:hypothetical protein
VAEERAELEKAGTVVVLMRGCAALDLVSPTRAARTISRSLSCVLVLSPHMVVKFNVGVKRMLKSDKRVAHQCEQSSVLLLATGPVISSSKYFAPDYFLAAFSVHTSVRRWPASFLLYD